MQSTLPPKGLPGGVVSQPSVLYGIALTGALGWYRHNGAQIGAGLNTPGAWSGRDAGYWWQNFKEVFGMGDGIIYAIAGDGKLKWYKHTGFRDGTKAWDGPKDVGTGWQNFKQVFGAGNGVINVIAGDGILKWYKHTGYQDGSFAWEGPKNVGTGWQNFKEVFGMGDGIIYAIAGDGKLKWYKHTGFQNGTFAWEGPKDVGTGWQNFKTGFRSRQRGHLCDRRQRHLKLVQAHRLSRRHIPMGRVQRYRDRDGRASLPPYPCFPDREGEH